jgi:hypothetical protein
LEATEVFLCTGSGTKLIADEGLKIAGFKRDLNGTNKELFPAPASHSTCKKGFYQAGYIHGGNTPFGDAGNKVNLNLQYQVELDSGLRYIRLVPGQKQGKLKPTKSNWY